MRNGKDKGLTLIEIIIYFVIFSIVFTLTVDAMDDTRINLSKILFLITGQARPRAALRDIEKNANNATWTRFVGSTPRGIYYYDGDYRHALLLQSSLKDDGKHTYSDADDDGNLVATKFILYYIVRPVGDTCQPAVDTNNGAPTESTLNPDINCPHKLLIKKEISIYDFSSYDKASVFSAILPYLTSENKNSPKVLTEDMLDFIITSPVSGTIFTDIYYNGEPISADNKSLIIRLKSFKTPKKTYTNENLLNETSKINTLETIVVPKN